MAKDYKSIAQAVLNAIGGDANVSHLEHCSTRLRFSIVDMGKVDKEALKKTKGVMGVVSSGNQCQVVIGNDVIEVYDELVKMGNFQGGSGKAPVSGGEKKAVGAVVLDFIVGIFQPLIPAIAGAGIAGASTIKTGLNASRLGISAYVAPYVFVLNPVLLLINTHDWSTPMFVLMILEAAIITIVGMVCLAMGLSGYCVMPCSIWERAILIAGGIFMVMPYTWSDILGIAILVIMIVQQKLRKRKATPAAA